MPTSAAAWILGWTRTTPVGRRAPGKGPAPSAQRGGFKGTNVTSDGNDSGNNGGHRLPPRPISRPPVDPAARQAFGRPDGLQGSFVAERVRPPKYRDQTDFTPYDPPADPVLQEAFSRPPGAADTLQRHPVDAGALAAEKDG